MVKPGDTVKPDESLITVESDNASMEIPSSHGGVVKELKVKICDKVDEGSLVLLLLEAAENPSGPKNGNILEENQAVGLVPIASKAISNVAILPPPPSHTSAPNAASFSGTVDLDCDLLVLFSACVIARKTQLFHAVFCHHTDSLAAFCHSLKRQRFGIGGGHEHDPQGLPWGFSDIDFSH